MRNPTELGSKGPQRETLTPTSAEAQLIEVATELAKQGKDVVIVRSMIAHPNTRVTTGFQLLQVTEGIHINNLPRVRSVSVVLPFNGGVDEYTSSEMGMVRLSIPEEAGLPFVDRIKAKLERSLGVEDVRAGKTEGKYEVEDHKVIWEQIYPQEPVVV